MADHKPQFSEEQIVKVGQLLNNPGRPLKERFRALFTLKNVGGPLAVEWMGKAFSDESSLLKHEVAYCLGQLQHDSAIPILEAVLRKPIFRDTSREAIVRHEAAEALGAIGKNQILPVLEEFLTDPCVEVRETCELAVSRIKWEQEAKTFLKELPLSENPYNSVDPAPAALEQDTGKLRQVLEDGSRPLFDRYRAMFSLRNKGDEESVRALAGCLDTGSALFRHEIAFVLGQMSSPAAAEQLAAKLADTSESAMVRHECAEALGGIASQGVDKELEKYLGSSEAAVVRESCEVALDMCDYANSHEFQYANALAGAQPS